MAASVPTVTTASRRAPRKTGREYASFSPASSLTASMGTATTMASSSSRTMPLSPREPVCDVRCRQGILDKVQPPTTDRKRPTPPLGALIWGPAVPNRRSARLDAHSRRTLLGMSKRAQTIDEYRCRPPWMLSVLPGPFSGAGPSSPVLLGPNATRTWRSTPRSGAESAGTPPPSARWPGPSPP